MKHIKKFESYTINESENDEFLKFISDLINNIRYFSRKDIIEILKNNKGILRNFYEKMHSDELSGSEFIFPYHLGEEINKLHKYLSAKDILDEFNSENSFKSIIENFIIEMKKFNELKKSRDFTKRDNRPKIHFKQDDAFTRSFK